MANGRGPSTALQVAVIIFAMLSVGLGVFSFYAFHQWCEEFDKKEAASTETNRNNARVNQATNHIGKLVAMITGKDDSSKNGVKAALDQYEQDMNRAASTFAQAQPGDVAKQVDTRHGTLRNYRDTIQLLLNTIAAAKSAMDDPRLGETPLIAQRGAKISALDKNAQDSVNAVDEAELAPGVEHHSVAEIYTAKASDLNRTAEAYDGKTKQISDDNKMLAEKVREITDKLAALTVEFEKKLSKIKGEINKFETQVRVNKGEINRRTLETFEVPDGEITWVNPRARTVWINLGRADKLPPQITFSVYPKDGTDVGRGKRKGAIEVTKILDERLAEARILEDNLTNALLPGDKIYTPAWHPRRPEHVSMCGHIDLDGDDIGDWELMYSLLRAAGATLDKQQLPNGELAGEQTANTRYLIVGPEPVKTGNANAIANYGKILKEADTLGIKTIPLKDFLMQVGFTETTDFKSFGLGSDPRDFDHVTRKGEESGQAVAKFRERHAPRRGNLGAYGKENNK